MLHVKTKVSSSDVEIKSDFAGLLRASQIGREKLARRRREGRVTEVNFVIDKTRVNVY
jgi:hypothetical protein